MPHRPGSWPCKWPDAPDGSPLDVRPILAGSVREIESEPRSSDRTGALLTAGMRPFPHPISADPRQHRGSRGSRVNRTP